MKQTITSKILKKARKEARKKEKYKRVSKIQALWQGYTVRKGLALPKDLMTLKIVNILLDRHIKIVEENEQINKILSEKSIRNPNFMSEISENIVKYALLYSKKYKIFPNWDTESGDLDWIYKKIEVKCFSSLGPSSFGPTEKWDLLYFLDAMDFKNKNFKLYEIRMSNNHDTWCNIKMNKQETYKEQCDSGKRPHIAFEKIKEQLDKINVNYCKLIWSGHISELDNVG